MGDQRRLLVTWVGHADLRSMAAALPKSDQERVLAGVGDPLPEGTLGPVRTLLEQEQFDEIHILSNYDKERTDLFMKWLGRPCKARLVELDNPTDYAAIFTVADEALRQILGKRSQAELDLSFHLSPGTPAMAAIWLLLGKSRYPASFYQSFDKKAWVTEIPFDLVVDFVPEVLRNPDSHLQHLATHSPSEVEGFEEIAGESKAIRIAVGRACKAALRGVPVLILGETGSGKEMFARAIHRASSRRDGPFVAINCAAIPKELLDSELFGHKKGGFTGATADHKGAFEAADGGTLFLDEVGECDPAMQAKLLRALQPVAGKGPCHRTIRRVGESRDRACDVRVIAATNRDLLGAVRDGGFREDLYYRLAVITINLPPLRDRRADIPRIAQRLMDQINQQFEQEEPGYIHKSISSSTMEFVRRQPWRGNVRQLHNVLLQAAVMSAGDTLQRADIAEAIADVPVSRKMEEAALPLGDGFSLEKHLEETQKAYLARAMEEADGSKTKAAKLLGYRNYQTLDAQLKRLNVKWKRA